MNIRPSIDGYVSEKQVFRGNLHLYFNQIQNHSFMSGNRSALFNQWADYYPLDTSNLLLRTNKEGFQVDAYWSMPM